MQRVSRLPLLLLIAGAALLVLRAQQTSPKAAQVHPHQAAWLAPYVPPIAGTPFTAEYTIRAEKPLAGEGSDTWHSITRVARDSDGRIRHELHGSVPATSTKAPPLACVVLSDPVARLSHTLDPVLHTDDRRWFHASHQKRFDADNSDGEDLGTGTLAGLLVRGERRTRSLPPQLGAAGKPGQVVDETWYSSELQLVVFEQQTDSAGLKLTITMTNLDRGEPDASLFKVSRGYHLPIVGPVAPWLGQWPITSPDQTPNISGAW